MFYASSARGLCHVHSGGNAALWSSHNGTFSMVRLLAGRSLPTAVLYTLTVSRL